MKSFIVEMLAFGNPGELRTVDVPDCDVAGNPMKMLDSIYKWGQNDFQPKAHPSVSVGDVIRLVDNRYEAKWLVCNSGFRLLTEQEYAKHLMKPRITRALGLR